MHYCEFSGPDSPRITASSTNESVVPLTPDSRRPRPLHYVARAGDDALVFGAIQCCSSPIGKDLRLDRWCVGPWATKLRDVGPENATLKPCLETIESLGNRLSAYRNYRNTAIRGSAERSKKLKVKVERKSVLRNHVRATTEVQPSKDFIEQLIHWSPIANKRTVCTI